MADAVRAAMRVERRMGEGDVVGVGGNVGTAAAAAAAAAPAAPVKKRRKRVVDANWKRLQATLDGGAGAGGSVKRRKKARVTAPAVEAVGADGAGAKKFSSFVKGEVLDAGALTRVVALDCEMVGVGREGRESVLARVSCVNFRGDVLYDKFVRVHDDVTDYRTHVSGVRAEDVAPDADGAVEPYMAQKAIGEIIRGRLLVGHALKNDLRVLRLAHPWREIRDTSEYYRKLWKRTKGRRSSRPPALRVIVASVLGVDRFQKDTHDSCEDARAALALYKHNASAWELSLRTAGKGKNDKAKKKETIKSA